MAYHFAYLKDRDVYTSDPDLIEHILHELRKAIPSTIAQYQDEVMLDEGVLFARFRKLANKDQNVASFRLPQIFANDGWELFDADIDYGRMPPKPRHLGFRKKTEQAKGD